MHRVQPGAGAAGGELPARRRTRPDRPAGSEKDPAFRQVCVWEVYDKVNHEVLYLADFKHHIIGRASWPVNLRFGCRDMFPQTLLYSHPVPGRFYPRPEAELIAPQLREINITERLISEDSRTKFRKWITIQGILTEDQKSKITDTTVANAMLYVDMAKLQDLLGITGAMDPAGVDLRNLVVPIEDIAPKKDLYVRYEMLEKEIQHIVGYGPAARGGLPSTRSAREAMMINQRQDQRLDKSKSRVADFHRSLAQKHIRFLQKYMSVERYAKVLPKAGQLTEWVKYGRDDIQGDFEFDVVTGSSVAEDDRGQEGVRDAALSGHRPDHPPDAGRHPAGVLPARRVQRLGQRGRSLRRAEAEGDGGAARASWHSTRGRCRPRLS